MVIASGLGAIQGIWSLFSSEPLIPSILTKVTPILPLWSRLLAILFFGSLTAFGIILLIAIFRQTKAAKTPEDGIQPIMIAKDKQVREHITVQQYEVITANYELDSLQRAVELITRRAGRSDVTAGTGLTEGSSITVGIGTYALNDYLTGVIKGTYSIDATGALTGTDYPGNVTWDATTKRWKKA